MSNQNKLLSYGHTPVYLEVNNQDYIKLTKGKLPFYRQKWKRISDKEIEYFKGEDGLELIFSHNLSSKFQKSDHIFFAYIYPFTYQDSILSMNEIEHKCSKNDKIFFQKQTVGQSIEGRDLIMITIAS